MKTTKKEQQPRDRILAVKITAGEQKELADYAEKKSVNMSALVRKLLFETLRKDAP